MTRARTLLPLAALLIPPLVAQTGCGEPLDPSAPAQSQLTEKDPLPEPRLFNQLSSSESPTTLFGLAANDLWGLGGNGAIINWDGTTWRRFPSPTSSSIYAAWGSAKDNIWAVGNGGTLIRWNGTAWLKVTGSTIPTGVSFNDVWGTSASDVWVVGSEGVILRYNGTTWTSLSTAAINNLYTVWASSTTNAWVGGELGMLLRWNGTSFAEVSSGGSEDIRMIRGSSANRIWMIIGGNVRQWNGTTWTSAMVNGSKLFVLNDNAAWAYGQYSQNFFNGTTWAYTRFPTDYAQSLWWESTSSGWLTTSYAQLYRYNGMTWSQNW